jgi:esterase/lipase superfamily enzyme
MSHEGSGVPDSLSNYRRGLSLLKEAALDGEPYAYLASANVVREITGDNLGAFQLAAAADEIGGGTYAEEANRIKLAICNETVDVNCEPVPVFYVTNRLPSTDPNGVRFENRVDTSGAMHYGVAYVTLPLRPAQSIERKGYLAAIKDTFARLNPFRSHAPPSPNADGAAVHAEAIDGGLDEFLELTRSVGENNSRPKAMIFVHGFNNTFNAAATRMAILSEQFKYPGVPIILDWASAGEPLVRIAGTEGLTGLGYQNDEQTVIDSCPDFRAVLRATIAKFGSDNTAILAHSMGGRLLYYMLTACPGVPETWDPNVLAGDLIFAAPDIGAKEFERSAPFLEALSKQVTLYVSANDAALRASGDLRGGRYRAGEGGDVRLVLKDIYTIDASSVENSAQSDFLNHAYVFDVPQTKKDLSDLLRGLTSPSERDCPAEYTDSRTQLPYWIIQPGCAS